MRPSQYNYIKRALTRTMFRRSQQKKRIKAKKKELRKQNKLMRKQQRKGKRQPAQIYTSDFSPSIMPKEKHELDSSLLIFGGIAFGLLTVGSVSHWLADIQNVYEQVGIIPGLIILLTELILFGIPSFLCFYFYYRKEKQNKDISDNSHYKDNSFEFTDTSTCNIQSNKQNVPNLKQEYVASKITEFKTNDTHTEEPIHEVNIPFHAQPVPNIIFDTHDSNTIVKNEESEIKSHTVENEESKIKSRTVENKESEIKSYTVKTKTPPKYKSESHTTVPEKNIKSKASAPNKTFSDAFAALCIANCELDKEQNHINDITGGNVRYNDKRFDNLVDDPLIKQMVSAQKIKEISEKIIQVYSQIGLRVIIDGTICTTQYVILELKPMNGAKIDDILSFQNNIEYAIEMKTLMNVMYKKGYIGILLPIQYFIQQ